MRAGKSRRHWWTVMLLYPECVDGAAKQPAVDLSILIFETEIDITRTVWHAFV